MSKKLLGRIKEIAQKIEDNYDTENRKISTNSVYLIACHLCLYNVNENNINNFIICLKNISANTLYDDYQKIIDAWAKNEDVSFDKEHFIEVLCEYRSNCWPHSKVKKTMGEITSKINDDRLAFLYELIQNADDCKYDENNTPAINITIKEDYIDLYYNENGMTEQDIISITSINESTKGDKSEDEQDIAIGEKGIGFKTVFAACEKVDVISGEYKFSLINCGYNIEKLDSNLDDIDGQGGTKMRLHLRNNSEINEQTNGISLYKKLCEKFGVYGNSDNSSNTVFQNCPVMFTKNLTEINVICENESFSVKTTDKAYNEKTVSFKLIAEKNGINYKTIDCFGIYKNIEIDEDTYNSRYHDSLPEGQKTARRRIEIIAALDETVTRGNMYSYLPANQKIKAPFNIQLPVKMNLNRTRMFFNGDSDTSKNNNGISVDKDNPETISWNKLMVRSFIEMIPDFYEALKTKTEKIYKYIPEFRDNNKQLFDLTDMENYMNSYCKKMNLSDVFESIEYFRKADANEYCAAHEAIMFEHFIQSLDKDNAEKEWFELLSLDKLSKKLIRYDKEILEYGERVGLKLFDYERCENLTDLLNALIKAVSAENYLLETIANHSDSNFKDIAQIFSFIEDKRNLRIFPAKTDNGVEYIKAEGIWIKSDKYTSPESYFFHFTDNDNVFKALNLDTENEDNPLESIKEQKKALTVDEFEQVNNFICKYYLNDDENKDKSVYERCKAFIENKKDDEIQKQYAEIIGMVELQ